MSVSSDARLKAELEAGAARLAMRQAAMPAEEVVPAPAPVDPNEGVTLSITGIGNYEVGQTVTTIVGDAPASEGELVAAQESTYDPAFVPEIIPAAQGSEFVTTQEGEAVLKYTAEELDAVIAADGIEGLRRIAEPLGVKGRGKAELKSEILAFFAAQAPEA